jgi:hypothetical protein
MASKDIKQGYNAQKGMQKVSEEYEENGMIEGPTGGMNSTNQNIGPDFTPNKSKGSRDFTKGVNKAKAEAQEATGPNYSKGGSISSASKRADGCALRGKTRA